MSPVLYRYSMASSSIDATPYDSLRGFATDDIDCQLFHLPRGALFYAEQSCGIVVHDALTLGARYFGLVEGADRIVIAHVERIV